MAKEIERKFLVKGDSFKKKAFLKHDIRQFYLSTDKGAVVRVRIRDDKAFLTVKGANTGAVRDEWEWEIPYRHAVEMAENLPIASEILKTRYKVDAGGGLTWEIDVFHGRLDGLVIAEIELPDANTEITLPDFIAAEVTGNPAYYNSNIATNPPPFF